MDLKYFLNSCFNNLLNTSYVLFAVSITILWAKTLWWGHIYSSVNNITSSLHCFQFVSSWVPLHKSQWCIVLIEKLYGRSWWRLIKSNLHCYHWRSWGREGASQPNFWFKSFNQTRYLGNFSTNDIKLNWTCGFP